jgi:hypothetical protein
MLAGARRVMGRDMTTSLAKVDRALQEYSIERLSG